MKKLITLLMSLTLCLGMGTAFAVEPPVFHPATGSTVQPGQTISFDEPDMERYGTSVVVYTFDAADKLEGLDREKVDEIIDMTLSNQSVDGVLGSVFSKAAATDDDDENPTIGGWMPKCKVPVDAEGTVTLQARMVFMPVEDESPIETSAIVSAIYTVEGEALGTPVPTFNPLSNAEVKMGGSVELSYEATVQPGEYTAFGMYYIIDNPDFDLTQYDDDYDIGKEKEVTIYAYNSPVRIYGPTTITAATAEMYPNGQILAWSKQVTATYTVIPPIAPEFSPNGGRVEADAPITLTTTEEGGKIYYTKAGDATAETFTSITTEDALNETIAVMPYDADEKFTLEDLGATGGSVTVLAATALTGGGKVVWSPVVEKAFTVLGNAEDLVITPAEDAKIGDNVTITGPDGATLYYTTNGAEPTAQSTPYTAPFAITEDMLNANLEVVIRAIAIKDGNESFRRANLQIIPTDPVFSPEAGEVRNGTEITLSSVPAAAAIYYTVDGSEPTETSFRYTQPIAIDKNQTVKARAYLQQRNSEIATAEYTVIEIPQPVFTPVTGLVEAGRELACTINYDLKNDPFNTVFVIYVENNDEVVLETTFEDLMNVMEPNNQTAPLELPYKVAVCHLDYGEDGQAVYAWNPAVTISDNVPTEFSFRARTVVLAEVEEDVFVPDYSKEIKTYYYTKLPVPNFNLAGEVQQGDVLNVKFPDILDLSVYLDQAFILYAENDDEVELTFNGTMAELQTLAQGGSSVEPLAKAGQNYRVANYINEFGGSWNPAVYLTELGEVKVRARLAVGTRMDGQLIYSDEFTATYTVAERPAPEAPSFMIGGKTVTGASFEVAKGTEVGFESGYEDEMYDEYIVCYVVNGQDADFAGLTETAINMGNTPVKMYDSYIPQSVPVVSEAQTIKAATGLLLESKVIWWSDIVTVDFTVQAVVEETVAKPTFDPEAGVVEKGTKVTIACETEGATIYYALTELPENLTEATEYVGQPIVINEAVTIKAIAIKGDAKSDVAEATYTVKPGGTSANEDEELAGVTVYPNPSNGVLNIELPVAATVEVFGINGVLMQYFNANAGNTTLNINRSGIYFLRITGEGRTAIKRVIVR